MNLSFEEARRMLQAGDTGIKFTVKDVKNPNTGRPTDSFAFSQITVDGFEVSKTEYGVPIQNTKPYSLYPYSVDIRPLSFKTKKLTPYDVTIYPRTFQQNMKIELTLPA